jgi:hypothetical protein
MAHSVYVTCYIVDSPIRMTPNLNNDVCLSTSIVTLSARGNPLEYV